MSPSAQTVTDARALSRFFLLGLRSITHARTCVRPENQKATRLLGVVQRLMTGTIEEIKLLSSRSTFYADKRDLRQLGLWPPSAVSVELPGLRLPPLEQLLRTKLFCCRTLQLSLIVRIPQPGLRAPPDRGTRDTILGGNVFFGEHWR